MTEQDESIASETRNDGFLIDGSIHFSVSEYTLESDSLPTPIKLQRPAGRCLQLLIESRGSLVTQNDLIDFGWGVERAKYISQNAFYQAMHHLRQSLHKAGCSNLIFTIPRQGTGISSDISIIRSPSPSLIPSSGKKRLSWRNLTIILMLALCGCIILIYSKLDTSSSEALIPDDVFRNYTLVLYKNCHLYLSDKSIDKNKIASLLQQSNTDCMREQKVFITSSDLSPRKGLLICPVYNRSRQICHTAIVMSDSL